MPGAAASFLKSASQRSKLPVLRQLAFWAAAGAGARARRTAMRPRRRNMIGPPAIFLQARTLFRIGWSAVVDDSVTVEGIDCRHLKVRVQALLADLAASRLS